MSVKHIEYLKVNDSKLLVVELRPVKCLLDTPSGPLYSDKWMDHSHWKELHHILLGIVDEYEEQRVSQNVKCNQPKCRSGETIQMGYMFRNLPSCWCSLYFLTPRSSCTWMEKEYDGNLQDKGGNFEDLVACGEMLVISVILRDPAEHSQHSVVSTNSTTNLQQARLHKKLIQALDSKMEYNSSISDYFSSSSTFGQDSASKDVPSSNRGSDKHSSLGVKTGVSRRRKEHSKKENYSSTIGKDLDSYSRKAIVNSSMHLNSTSRSQNSQNEEVLKDEEDCAIQLNKNREKEIHLPKKSCGIKKNQKHFTELTPKKEDCRDMLSQDMEFGNLYLPKIENGGDCVRGNSSENLQTLEGECNTEIEKELIKNSPVVKYEADEIDSLIEVKEEAFVCSPFGNETDIFHKGDTYQENDGFKAQNVTYVASSASNEQNESQNVFDNPCLFKSEAKENLEENTLYIPPETEFQKSFIRLFSTDRSQSVQTRWCDEGNKMTCFREDEIGLEVEENEHHHRNDTEYPHQRDIAKSKRKRLMEHSSTSYCMSELKKYSSATIKTSLSDENLRCNTSISSHSANMLKNFHSSVDKGNEIHVEVQGVDGVVAPCQKKWEKVHMVEKDVDFFPTCIEDHVQEIPIEAKVHERSLTPKSLVSLENDNAESSDVHKKSYSSTVHTASSKNCTYVEFDTGPLQTTSSSNPSRKTTKFVDFVQPVTQPTLDKEQYEDRVTSDSELEHSLNHRMKYDGRGKRSATHTKSTKKTKTGLKSQCLPTSKCCILETKESVVSPENYVIAENTTVLTMPRFEDLSFSVKKRKQSPGNMLMPAQMLEVNDSLLSDDVNAQDLPAISCESVEKWSSPKIQNQTIPCFSSERLVLQEYSQSKYLNLDEENFDAKESPETTVEPMDDQFPLKKKLPQQILGFKTKEAHESTSRQKNGETKKSLIEILRSIRISRTDSEESHSVQDLRKENAESSLEDSPFKTLNSSSMSDEFLLPETKQSKESEEDIANLRRSKRVKTRSSTKLIESYSEHETSDEDKEDIGRNTLSKSVKSRKSPKTQRNEIERNGVLKQMKIVDYVKTCSSSEKQNKKSSKAKCTAKESTTLTDEYSKQDCDSKQHKSLKKDLKSPNKILGKEMVSKPSTSKKSKSSNSKHKPSNATQAKRKKGSMNCYDEIWNFSFPSVQADEDPTNGNNSKKKKKKISPQKKSIDALEETVEKAKGQNKKAKKQQPKSNTENCSPSVINEDFYRFIQAETEKLSALAFDIDEPLGSPNFESSQEVPSKSKGKRKKSHKRKSGDEECLILNEVPESTSNLDSLRSSYKLLCNMTEDDLEQRLDDSIPYLEKVILGVVPNERHELYKKSSHELKTQQDYLIYGPFTAEQSLFVLDLLKKKLCHLDRHIGDLHDILTYRCRVLVPTFFTKIVMENENVNMKEAHRLMAQFTLNKEIADDISSAGSRKF